MPDVAELLAQAEWLTRLARSLTGDAAEADDVVQDTYAAALHAPAMAHPHDVRGHAAQPRSHRPIRIGRRVQCGGVRVLNDVVGLGGVTGQAARQARQPFGLREELRDVRHLATYMPGPAKRSRKPDRPVAIGRRRLPSCTTPRTTTTSCSAAGPFATRGFASAWSARRPGTSSPRPTHAGRCSVGTATSTRWRATGTAAS